MVYIVDDAVSKTPLAYIKGICFESTDVDISRYKVNGIVLDEYSELTNEDIVSAIIFKGIIENELCILEIYKNSENINIRYRKQNNVIDEEENTLVHSENIELPILNSGKINVLEVNSIIDVLISDEFINMVTAELSRFSKKLYIKDRIIEEEYDPLSPRLLLDKDLDLIANIVGKNKKAYIRLIEDEFNLVSHLNGKRI